MMSFKESFYAAFLSILKEYGFDAVEVTNVEETTESGGYCETCWYETQVVEVTYVDSNGIESSYTISDNLSDLINRLIAQ